VIWKAPSWSPGILGRLSWGVVPHEYADRVDFLVLDDADRARLQTVLGGGSWWQIGGLPTRR
jgi:hypothetical protein